MSSSAALRRAPVLVACTVLVAACQPFLIASAPKVTRAAVPAAVDETLNTLNDPGTRQRVADLMGTPEMQQAVGDLAAAASERVIRDVSSDEADERLAEVTARLTDAFTRALVRGLGEQQRALSDAVDAAAATATHAAMRAAAEDMRGSLGPAVREALVDALGSPDLRAAIDETVVEATTSAKTSLNGGELPSRPLLARLQNLVTFAWCVAAASVLALLVGVGVLVVRARRRRGAPPPQPPPQRAATSAE
jgi:hypothetical protein